MSKNAQKRPVERYHHGDLRAALIAAARKIVEKQGLAKLSLRAAARLAGVSQAAPYHHFKDKTALLAAVARAGFAELADAITAGIAVGTAAPEKLRAAGVAYVLFATANPALYQLMFGGDFYDQEWENTGSDEVAYGLLKTAIKEAAAAKRSLDIEIAALSAWSSVHGLSKLLIERKLDPSEYGCSSVGELAASVLSNSQPHILAKPKNAKALSRKIERAINAN